MAEGRPLSGPRSRALSGQPSTASRQPRQRWAKGPGDAAVSGAAGGGGILLRTSIPSPPQILPPNISGARLDDTGSASCIFMLAARMANAATLSGF